MSLDRRGKLLSAAGVFAYVHDFDPVIFDVVGPLKLRWYGLSYLMAFVVGFFVLRTLSRRGLWCVEEKKIGDFMAMLAMVGVFLGGRLGYVLFYMIPKEGIASVMADPLSIIRVWDGGMASHGGFLGVMIFTWFYARKNKHSWTAVGDGICVAAPLGLMFGRIANFLNGELYGRVAHGVPWAMKFPQSLEQESENNVLAIQDALFQKEPTALGSLEHGEMFAEAVRNSDGVKAVAEEFLQPRHPSQLYEAFGEGGLLFIVMWVLRVRFPKAPHGMLTGVFFILYASARVLVEQFREPDSAMILGLTKGQFYSLFMIVMGVLFLVGAKRSASNKI